jgi:hypothetical protein
MSRSLTVDHPEYRIITVADFQQVPDDRLEACLLEFVGAMLQVRPLQKENLGMESLTWVDDGIPAIESFNLKIGDQEENIPNPHFPQR